MEAPLIIAFVRTTLLSMNSIGNHSKINHKYTKGRNGTYARIHSEFSFCHLKNTCALNTLSSNWLPWLAGILLLNEMIYDPFFSLDRQRWWCCWGNFRSFTYFSQAFYGSIIQLIIFIFLAFRSFQKSSQPNNGQLQITTEWRQNK